VSIASEADQASDRTFVSDWEYLVVTGDVSRRSGQTDGESPSAG
jgi:hypothetical protein